MTTSGSINFNQTRDEIIYDALSMIRVVEFGESLSIDDINLGTRVLNRLVKSWQQQGVHLWKKKEATLFLAKDTNSYLLGGSSGTHATESYVSTALSADAAIGVTTLTVTSTTGMSTNDFIGVVLDDNTLFWATVNTVISSTSVSINNALLVAASSGNYIFSYTTKITRPLFILAARRFLVSSNQEIPMIVYSHEEYYELPNKTSSGASTTVNYDPQLGSGIFKLWQTPSNIANLIKFTYGKSIEDFDSLSDYSDFPQEWLEAIVLNLATKLAYHYGKATAPDFQSLKQDAAMELERAKTFDSEPGSVFFQPTQYRS